MFVILLDGKHLIKWGTREECLTAFNKFSKEYQKRLRIVPAWYNEEHKLEW